MSWQKIRLGDIAEFSNGVNFDKSAYSPGVQLIAVSDFGDRNCPNYSELIEVSKEAVRGKDYLRDGDIVFVRSNGNKALVGRCMLIDKPPRPVTFSGFCIRARLSNTDNWNPRFFMYYCKSDVFRKSISASTSGTNIQNLNQKMLAEHIATVPDIAVQNRIAAVLGTYDDLIDNCRRQIKLLEEAAQRLYREWFVDMRFPGHEDVDFVDGLPEGWAKCRLSDFAEFRRGKVITAKQTKPGTVPVVAGGLTPAYYHDASNTVAPVITVSGSGANAGYTALYGREIWASDCSFLDSEKTDYIYFVFLTVKVLGRGFKHLQRGSAQPHVYPSHINELQFICPSCEALNEFEMLVESMFKKVRVLEAMIEQLREARDRLLPMLMSKEDVV